MHSLEEPVRWQEEDEARLAKQCLLFAVFQRAVPMSAVYHRFESALAIYPCFLLSSFITQPQQDKTAGQTTRFGNSTKKREESVQNRRKLHVRAMAPPKGSWRHTLNPRNLLKGCACPKKCEHHPEIA